MRSRSAPRKGSRNLVEPKKAQQIPSAQILNLRLHMETNRTEDTDDTFELILGELEDSSSDSVTQLFCGQCESAYFLGEVVGDERLMTTCGVCAG